MFYLSIVALWLVLAFVVATGAKNRGRSFIGFFILSVTLSPLISGFILIVLGNATVSTSHSTFTPNQRSISQTEKKCKSCGSIISVDFRKCPNCGSYEFSDGTLNLEEVQSGIKQSEENVSIKCPYCSSKFSIHMSSKDFIETKCIKCKKKITLKNVIFE
jgi:RNA polymerase subunit RPABC4/transcription elongation factor Spt4